MVKTRTSNLSLPSMSPSDRKRLRGQVTKDYPLASPIFDSSARNKVVSKVCYQTGEVNRYNNASDFVYLGTLSPVEATNIVDGSTTSTTSSEGMLDIDFDLPESFELPEGFVIPNSCDMPWEPMTEFTGNLNFLPASEVSASEEGVLQFNSNLFEAQELDADSCAATGSKTDPITND